MKKNRFHFVLVAVLATLIAAVSAFGAMAEDRALTLHHTHTGKDVTIVFKRDGRFVAEGIAQLNLFLADWRNGKQTDMDPALFDLLWSVYQDVGAQHPIHIVSSYRSPETNAMLRANSSGVAENSQHIQGRAMDIFIPGIRLDVLRAAAMRRQGGGVGYYPTSASPFVHLDTGSVRAWPRMTTAQLQKIFPEGVTAHLPSDGPALPGHATAVAALSAPVAAAPAAPPASVGSPRTLMELFFGSKETPAPAALPTPAVVVAERLLPSPAGIDLALPVREAPVPMPRPVWMTASADPVQVASAALPAAPVQIKISDEDYVFGYATPGLVADDPFAFVNDLVGPPRLVAAVLPSRGHSDERVPDMGPATWPSIHTAQPFQSAAFAGLQAPSLEDVRFLITPLDPGMATSFQPLYENRF